MQELLLWGVKKVQSSKLKVYAVSVILNGVYEVKDL